MNLLFLAWQDSLSRRWHVVGRLTEDKGCYRFEYAQGAQIAQQFGFCPLSSFPDLHAKYESNTLFPLFANRLLSRSRPDYSEFLQWLSLPEHQEDPFALLARSGGRRATDTLAVFPCPVQTEDGRYHVHAFVHGLSHMPPSSLDRAEQLTPGERLLIQRDFQNPVEPKAISLRTEGQAPGDYYMLGFVPQYFVDDFNTLLDQNPNPRSGMTITIERLNPAPAPVQFRLLCCFTMQWPDGFQPFISAEYQPIHAADLGQEPPITAALTVSAA